jgi:hypothetical protein
MYDVTTNNINSVRYQIGQKINYNTPYYATLESARAVVTDFDNFPYKRFFRGVYYEDTPVVMEREAGFRPRNDSCYQRLSIPQRNAPNYCWEMPCSTVRPCHGQPPADASKCSADVVPQP